MEIHYSKSFRIITNSILAVSLSLLMVHLIYVHKELLLYLNPHKCNCDTDTYRSYLFSITYSFATITVISLLQNDRWNKIYAGFDTVSVLIYYGSTLFTNFDINHCLQTAFYATLTGIASYTLGSLALKYFGTKEYDLQTLVSNLQTLAKNRDELVAHLQTLADEKLSLANRLQLLTSEREELATNLQSSSNLLQRLDDDNKRLRTDLRNTLVDYELNLKKGNRKDERGFYSNDSKLQEVSQKIAELQVSNN